MAELNEDGDVHKGRGKKRGGVRAKKASTKIDMTPMVDLGFLLVTFFILTTTMQRPKAMPIVMPDKEETKDTSKVRESEAMTIILGANDRIFYYYGITDPKVEVTNFAKIRNILIDKNQEVSALQTQNGWNQVGVIVLLKATDDSKYENFVNLLDELRISQVRTYAIVDMTDDEKGMLAALVTPGAAASTSTN